MLSCLQRLRERIPQQSAHEMPSVVLRSHCTDPGRLWTAEDSRPQDMVETHESVRRSGRRGSTADGRLDLGDRASPQLRPVEPSDKSHGLDRWQIPCDIHPVRVDLDFQHTHAVCHSLFFELLDELARQSRQLRSKSPLGRFMAPLSC